MIKNILALDEKLFLWLNSHHNQVFDKIMTQISTAQNWIPVYIFIIFLIFRKFSVKSSFYKILFIGASVGLSDYISSGIFKPFFERLRPCHNPEIMEFVHTVNHCGGQFGFVSSHAANSIALASAIFLIFGKKSGIFIFMASSAILISYSRIYLGVHYPIDIMAGVTVGFFTTFIIFTLLTNLKKQFT